MALAFFTAPIATLGSFGFGKPADSSDSSLRPESMGAGAVIKCSDCGGDVVLAELGEHVCDPTNAAKHQDESVNEIPPSPKAEKTSDATESTYKPVHNPVKDYPAESDTSSVASLTENLVKSMRPELKPRDISSSPSNSITMSPPSTKNSSSGFSFSNSETSSSSVSSSARTPFFEKYAQLKPDTTKNQTKPTLKNVGLQGRDRLKLSSKKSLSPITSPEPSPRGKKNVEVVNLPQDVKLPTFKPTPFSNLPEIGLASQRREAANRRLREEQNRETQKTNSNGLEKSTPGAITSRTANTINRHTPKAFEPEPKLPSSRTPTRDRHHKPSNPGDLEDLMGDLMAEMEQKAGLASEEYQSTMSRRTPVRSNVRTPVEPNVRTPVEPNVRTPVRPSVRTRENSTGSLKSGIKVEQNTARRAKPEAYPDNALKSYPRPPTGSDPMGDSPTPSSPGIKPSDSISQLGYTRSPSPKLVQGLKLTPVADCTRSCQRCGESPIRHVKNPTTDEARFCRQCYADLYLPKCRKCSKPIERGAVSDRVGKVLGKYHSDCFNCFQCSAPFPNGEFYVWERKPVCFKHYHRLAGTTCCNERCGQGIEGPCVSLVLEGSTVGSVLSDDSTQSHGIISNSHGRKLYHPEHFTCSRRGCSNSLHEFHFLLNGLPWCEQHALQEQDRLPTSFSRHVPNPHRDQNPPPFGRAQATLQPHGGNKRFERRRTIIQNVRNR